MAVSIEDIIKKEFSRSLMGYDMQEVDVFLDAIIDRIEKMELERAELVTAMEKLLSRVERLEKGAGGKAAVEGRERPVHKLTSAASPVRVQSARREAPEENAEAPQKKQIAGAVTAEAPAYAKPIRPAARVSAAPAPAQAVPDTPLPSPVRTEAVQPAPAATLAATAPAGSPAAPASDAAVAIELESGLYAEDGGELLPELLADIESTLLDGSIRPASQKNAPVRAAEKSRVS